MRALLTKWAWPAFDDARLLNLNKKRRKADMLRCVRRCQRGEYDFRAARRTSASPVAPGRRAGRRRPADAGTRALRLRFVAPQHRLSPHRVQADHTDAVVVAAAVATAAGGSPSVPRHAAVVDNLKSQGRSRLVSMPVRSQFTVTDETERRRSRVFSVVELLSSALSWQAARQEIFFEV